MLKPNLTFLFALKLQGPSTAVQNRRRKQSTEKYYRYGRQTYQLVIFVVFWSHVPYVSSKPIYTTQGILGNKGLFTGHIFVNPGYCV